MDRPKRKEENDVRRDFIRRCRQMIILIIDAYFLDNIFYDQQSRAVW